MKRYIDAKIRLGFARAIRFPATTLDLDETIVVDLSCIPPVPPAMKHFDLDSDTDLGHGTHIGPLLPAREPAVGR